MQKLGISLFVIMLCCIIFSCNKEVEEQHSEKFLLLTNHTWLSDSLLANQEEAGGFGQALFAFSGETIFNDDGTGTVGKYVGTWAFLEDETQIRIIADSLPGAVIAFIRELTEQSFKIEAGFLTQTTPPEYLDVRMTFKKK
jgi:hypothetical protein